MGDFRDVLDQIDEVKSKYENKISLLIHDQLIEFQKEIGLSPKNVTVNIDEVLMMGRRSPYELIITTKIEIGI